MGKLINKVPYETYTYLYEQEKTVKHLCISRVRKTLQNEYFFGS